MEARPDPPAPGLHGPDESLGKLQLRQQRDWGEQDPGPVPGVWPAGLLPEPLL